MSIVNGLVLDHFYFGLKEKEFQDLKNIFASLNGVEHSVVKSGEDSWEGIYVYTRIGSYIEFSRERNLENFSLAVSATQAHLFNPTSIREEYPHLPWKSLHRISEKGEPWFDALWLPYKNNEKEKRFYPWLMHYYPRHFIYENKPRPRLIDSTCRVEIACHPSMIELIQAQEFWLPGRFSLNHDNKTGTLFIRDRDATELEFFLIFDESVPGFQLRNMQLWLAREQTMENVKNDSWEVTILNGILKLTLNSN